MFHKLAESEGGIYEINDVFEIKDEIAQIQATYELFNEDAC